MSLNLPDIERDHIKTETITDRLVLNILYTFFFILYQPVFIYYIKSSVKRIKSEINMEVIDLFKVSQFVFLIGFLISRQIFFFLQYFPPFEYFYEPFSMIVLYFVNTFEWINISCWFLFIIHIWRYRKITEDSKYNIKWVKLIEKTVLGFLIFNSVVLLIYIFLMNSVAITAGCFFCMTCHMKIN
mmetsp:Transcript_1208/g.1085  ORF Transcript_1208/g.1085 Transcript_1208/m.1085 type:complete len:185 (+) Transcript_1208:1-555(+)